MAILCASEPATVIIGETPNVMYSSDIYCIPESASRFPTDLRFEFCRGRKAGCVWQLYLAHFGSLIWPTPCFRFTGSVFGSELL